MARYLGDILLLSFNRNLVRAVYWTYYEPILDTASSEG